MKPIDKLILTILLGLACPFVLLVLPEMEDENEGWIYQQGEGD